LGKGFRGGSKKAGHKAEIGLAIPSIETVGKREGGVGKKIWGSQVQKKRKTTSTSLKKKNAKFRHLSLLRSNTAEKEGGTVKKGKGGGVSLNPIK